MLPIRTILVPTDFSSTSAEALNLAASLARDHGARLVLLHVAGEPAFAAGMGVIPFDPGSYRDEVRDQFEQLAVRCPGLEVEQRLVEGPVIPEIVRAAGETGCDLIVMGAHGWTGLRRLLLGSVAEGVMRRAPCPVLTVRSPLPNHLRAGAPAEACAD